MKERTYASFTSVGCPNNVFYGENLDMIDPHKVFNENIVDLCAKHLTKNYPCPNNFFHSESLLMQVFERYSHLSNVNLGI